MLTSGHPPETRTRVFAYGHSPGPLKHDVDLGDEGLQAFSGIAKNGYHGVSSGEQGLRNKLRGRIGLLERFIYCKIAGVGGQDLLEQKHIAQGCTF